MYKLINRLLFWYIPSPVTSLQFFLLPQNIRLEMYYLRSIRLHFFYYSLQHCKNEGISCVSTRDFSLQCWHGFLGLDEKKNMLWTERVSAGQIFFSLSNTTVSEIWKRLNLRLNVLYNSRNKSQHPTKLLVHAASLKSSLDTGLHPFTFRDLPHCSSKETLRLLCVHLFSIQLHVPEHSTSTKYINDREHEEALRFLLPHEYQSIVMQSSWNASK